MSTKMVLLCAMSKEYYEIQSAIKLLAPSVDLQECDIIEDTPFELIRYRIQLRDSSTTGTFYVLKSGIGKVHAALATQLAIQRLDPERIINVGVSGGLYEGAQVGDLCLSTAYRYHDVWCGTGNEPGQVQGLPPQFVADDAVVASVAEHLGIRLRRGLLLCGDAFIPDAEHLSTFVAQYPDLVAVDMESGAIAQTAYLYDIPLVSIRIVSDTPLSAVDHNHQYSDFWQDKDRLLRSFTDVMRIVINSLEEHP